MSVLLNLLWDAKLNGWAWQIKSEFVALLRLMRDRNIKSVLEIGTNRGGTAYGFLSLGCEVVSVDKVKLPEVDKVNTDFPDTFKFILSDSKDFKTHAKFDMLFIDGDHEYHPAKMDYFNFAKNVNDKGLIVFHDAKDSSLHEKQNNGVSKLWKEFRGEKYTEYFDPSEEWGGIAVKFL